MRLIENEDDLREGMAALASRDGRLGQLIAANGLPPLRRRAGGFAGLVAIIVGQQLSVASAAAVMSRVERVFVPLTAERIAAATDEEMRLSGLSRPKQRTLRALAAATAAGLDLDGLTASDAEATLTAVSGIGPWTSDVYRLFCLGEADAFAPGDLALQEAARLVYGLPARPDARMLAALSERWRPWRGVAARLLWAHYAVTKRREGVG